MEHNLIEKAFKKAAGKAISHSKHILANIKYLGDLTLSELIIQYNSVGRSNNPNERFNKTERAVFARRRLNKNEYNFHGNKYIKTNVQHCKV